MNADKMKACVLIPCYNVEDTIGPLVGAIRTMGLDVVVVDDGSSDETARISQLQGAHVLSHKENLGKGASLRDGFDYLLGRDYDAVITMDGDGQHDPDDIDSFIRRAGSSDAALLIGNRMGEPAGMPFTRRATNRFMSYVLSRVTRTDVPDTQCGFRLIKRSLLERFSLRCAKFEIESEMVIQAARRGFAIDSVPIKSIYMGEQSKIRPIQDAVRFFRFLLTHKAKS